MLRKGLRLLLPTIIPLAVVILLVTLSNTASASVAREELPRPRLGEGWGEGVTGTNAISMTLLGTYETGISGESAAEIVDYDATSQRLFVTNSSSDTIDVLDASNPEAPTLINQIDVTPYGAGANSVAVSNGVVAVAVENDDAVSAGQVVFFDADGTFLSAVEAGALPDMITFTPDGQKVLVANEGEPGDSDPEGSVTIIDLSGGANVTQDDVMNLTFGQFSGRENEMRARGVRVFPNTDVAQDIEPEYIAVSPDSSTAFVTLQEGNAFGVIDIEAGQVVEILPLGLKNHARGPATLATFEFSDLPVLGTTAGGQDILLGGMSGLWFEGVDGDGNYQFVTIPDRGPNGAPTDVDDDGVDERPFALPDYQARVIRFELNPNTGAIDITQTLLLTAQDGTTPITGLPNIAGIDEEPVDLFGNLLDYDPLGADMEGVIVADDGSFWMVDEYRPAIYHFNANGVLIDRFVPQGTARMAGAEEGTYGTESLPAEYANRRDNRGFEGMALDTENNIIYAFIQTPLVNPTRAASDNSDVIRILGIDPATGTPVAEYVYLLEGVDYRDAKVDKIGDAVYAGAGKLYVVERDASTAASAKKYIFQVNLKGATNLLEQLSYIHEGRTTAEPYIFDLSGEYGILPLVTVGDEMPMLEGEFGNYTPNESENYAFPGTPDGLGVYETDDAYYVFSNHEFNSTNTSKINGASSNQINGSRVSVVEYTKDWRIVGGKNLIDTVETDGATYELDLSSGDYVDDEGNILNDGGNFARFCSGYLAQGGFVDADGNATPVWFAPEENDSSSRGWAAFPDGSALSLDGLGRYAKEQVYAASQYRADNADMTVLLSTEDNGDGELYMFIGEQTADDPNGFAEGQLYVLRVKDAADNIFAYETMTEGVPYIGEWTAISDSIALGSGDDLSDWVNAEERSTNFRRIEDLHEDPTHPGTFYFVTTGRNDVPPGGTLPDNAFGKLYRFTFNSDDPAGEMELEFLLEGGTETGVSYDNITVDSYGNVMIQEDRTAGGEEVMAEQERYGRVLSYNILSDTVEYLFEANQGFIDPSVIDDYGNWETSGIVEVSADGVTGMSSYLLDVQAHSLDDPDYVEGGQVLLAVPLRDEVIDGRTVAAPYIFDLPTTPHFDIMPLLTAGDEMPMLEGDFGDYTPSASENYAFPGTPDGLGVYETDDAYYVFSNHEFNSSSTSKINSSSDDMISGSRVSLLQFTKDWRIVGGKNLIETVLADGSTYNLDLSSGGYVDGEGNILNDGGNFARFCSGYLAQDGFVDADGNEVPVWFAPEENDSSSRGWAAFPDGSALSLDGLGRYAKEQVYAASQYRADNADMTVLLSTEDNGDGELYMFIGEQTADDPNGFESGQLYVLRVEDAEGNYFGYETMPEETILVGQWTAVPNEIALGSGNDLSDWVNDVERSTNFRRIEDLHEDPTHPGTFYFVTTGRNEVPPGGSEPDNAFGKLYRFTLNSDDPAGEMDFEFVLEGGAETGVSYDNITVDSYGNVMIQEDRTAGGEEVMAEQERYGRILSYDIARDQVTYLLEANQGVIDSSVITDYGNWETSGIVEAETIETHGRHAYLLDVQAHSIDDPDYVEGGQLLLAVDKRLELYSADELATHHIQPVNKIKVTNLPSIGYLAGDKPEGLALLDDGRLAVLNDNDFALLDEEIPGDGTIALNPDPTPITLGIIDFAEGNQLDASDRDGEDGEGAINMQNWPIYGMYMPDSIASFEANGQPYYLTANEGDARNEEIRIKDVTLDAMSFPNSDTLQSDEQLGRYTISLIDGDIDHDGNYDQLWGYGARSFSIWDEYGNLVFDSSDAFEQITALEVPEIFNSNGMTDTFDTRSDAKGPEPEAATVGQLDGRTYAFIGLERVGGIMVYDVTDPYHPEFVLYEREPMSDLAPEGFKFISAADSPTGEALLVVANEESGSTSIYSLMSDPDLDDDGVDNNIEDSVPNPDGSGTGDGNGDGIPDSQQANIASLPNANPEVSPDAGYVTLESPVGTTLVEVTATLPISLPEGVEAFPQGQFSFVIEGVSTDEPVSVTMSLHNNTNIPDSYWKQDAAGDWFEFTYDDVTSTGAISGTNDFGQTTFTLYLRDGERGDNDDIVGQITDPSAPAIKEAEIATSISLSSFEPQGTGTIWLPVALIGLLLVAGVVMRRNFLRSEHEE